MVVIWFLCDLFRPDSKLSCMEALALQPQISHLIRCSHFGRAVQLVCECVNSVYVAQAIIENGSDEMKTLGAKERTKVSNSNRHEDRMWKSNWECSNTCYKLNKIGFLSIVCGFVVTFFRFCSLSFIFLRYFHLFNTLLILILPDGHNKISSFFAGYFPIRLNATLFLYLTRLLALGPTA